jgi:proline iminopeptidase
MEDALMNARRTIRRLLVTVCLGCVCFVAAHAQTPRAPATAHPQSPLPRMTDWFLSTGSWQDDPQLYVREFGEGSRPVVMLHGGWGAEHSGLIDAVKTLGDRYRFIFYDQRGSLRSPSPDALITFDRHIDDLERLRQELRLEKLTIVGHSMGAVLASAYASKYPQHVAQLVLLSPAPLKNPIPEADKALQHEGFQALQAFMKRPEVAQELEKYSLTRTDPPLSSREETARSRIDFSRRMLSDARNWHRLTGGRALFKGHVDQLTSKTYPASGWDYVQEFRQRSHPVGIVVGDHDFLDFGNPLLRKWVQGIPQIELRIVKNAGHLIWVDQPERVSEELHRLLERHAPGRP